MKILYLENHAYFSRAVVKEFLYDYEVTVIASVSAAKKVIFDQAYDMVLSDYDLDDGKGDEFVTFINEQGLKVPVIACSSHDRGNELLISAGAVAVCSKMNFRQIVTVIESVSRNSTD